MKSLKKYIQEALVCEAKFISLDHPLFNNFVVMAGGAGSGKGYVQQFINAEFKILDVDALKIRYAQMFPLDTEKHDPDKGLYWGWDLGNEDVVSSLHELVKRQGWKKKQRNLVKLSSDVANSERQPNILLDMTASDKESLEEALTLANINCETTLIWVIQSISTALKQNASRARHVKPELLLKTHNDSFAAVLDYISNDLEQQFDNVYVYLNYNPKHTDVTDDEMKNKVFKLEKVYKHFEVPADVLNKIISYRERNLKLDSKK